MTITAIPHCGRKDSSSGSTAFGSSRFGKTGNKTKIVKKMLNDNNMIVFIYHVPMNSVYAGSITNFPISSFPADLSIVLVIFSSLFVILYSSG